MSIACVETIHFVEILDKPFHLPYVGGREKLFNTKVSTKLEHFLLWLFIVIFFKAT